MTIREAEEFIASVPWRAVKIVEVGDTGKTPDPHEYVIKDWREVDINHFDTPYSRVAAIPRSRCSASANSFTRSCTARRRWCSSTSSATRLPKGSLIARTKGAASERSDRRLPT